MARPGPITTQVFQYGSQLSSTNQQEDDADSDLDELQGDIERFDQTVQAFLSSRDSSNNVRGRLSGIRRHRGPRKAAEPRGDIKARLAKVNTAFMKADYDAARDMVFEIIRINAETHQAWVTLGSIFRELGDFDKALGSMVYAAHLRPKDVSGWLKCAEFALDAPEEGQGSLKTARLCYAAAIKAEPKNLVARLGKAIVCHRQGHIPAAIYEYKFVLQHRPDDLGVARKLAEACVDNSRSLESAVPSAITSFERCLNAVDVSQITWYDVGVFAELFASVGRHFDAIKQLKNLARRLVGRVDDTFWSDWDQDDREWDDYDVRRREVLGFDFTAYPLHCYGLALPLDLRTRLATYRLGLGDDTEATRHMQWVDPNDDVTRNFVIEFPFLVHDVADHLFRRQRYHDAHYYYQLLRAIPGPADASTLLQLGRCYVAFEDPIAAEEHFLGAIEADQDNIDARIELANLYENAKENEEALILATEAMALREAHGKAGASDPGIDRSRYWKANLTKRMRAAWTAAGLVRPRYRPKRLADPEKKRVDEQARTEGLKEQYRIAMVLKLRINSGERHLMSEWMEAARELVDGFRSLRKFYSWEKYLHFLGSTVGLVDEVRKNNDQSPLGKMVERLSKNLTPHPGHESAATEPGSTEKDEYQGISFTEWLALFLDYALSLALADRPYDSYQVCEAAKDCIAFGTEQSSFLIHVAWCACALICRDEEKCSAVAREFMRDDRSMSDPCRMFALLCRLCESPPSWYASGPTQKYLLRQIRAIDIARMQTAIGQTSGVAAVEPKLDICLLMLYGHILYTSASYTFALSKQSQNYFLRALALDPENPMINFSVGLGYIHYALKRQSSNRQFIIMQGLAFIQRYFNNQIKSPDPIERQTACYDMGRTYQLLGLHNLAHKYYQQCLVSTSEISPSPALRDATIGAAFNSLTTSILSNDLMAAKTTVIQWLHL